jgi:hypothetical protein
MTPYEHKIFREEQRDRQIQLANEWHHPLSKGSCHLSTVIKSMEEFKLTQEDVPLIIKLTENPEYISSKLFTGAVDLFTHDCIHVILGRGLLVKDEAFVIGYTMGSAKRMSRWRRNLFLWICKHLYPEGYKFTEEERYIFYSGVMAGSRCSTDLTQVKFKELTGMRIDHIRKLLGIDKDTLKCYYCLEKSLFTDAESQRLL